VLVVDDSAFMRKTISTILNQADDIEVVATARNGMDGVQKVTDYHPDVITLDIEMPVLQGLDALGYIMSECPTPVVMLSAYTENGGELTMKALEYGAVDFVCKPSGPISLDLNIVGQELISKVRIAARVDVTRLTFLEVDKPRFIKHTVKVANEDVPKAVVIASSTGGPRTLYEIIPKLPAGFPAAVLVVQHMTAGFTKSLAERLNNFSSLQVKEAEDGDVVLPGHVYIAPADFHMSLTNVGDRVLVALNKEPQRNSVRPAADVTMEAATKIYKEMCLGVVLTGMGRDGTEGGLAIKEAGGRVIAEDESSCVVFGMPKSIIATGKVDGVYALPKMVENIIYNVGKLKRKKKGK